MDNFHLIFLDYLFHFLHLALIAWNLTGWMVKKLRKIHFLSLNLVFFFWIVIGYFYGFGYCPLTDYHWKIKTLKGEQNLPNSYIVYLFHLFSFYPKELYIDFFVFIITFIIYILSLILCLKK